MIMAVLEKALRWVKAVAEHAIEATSAMVSKNLLANMVNSKYL